MLQQQLFFLSAAAMRIQKRGGGGSKQTPTENERKEKKKEGEIAFFLLYSLRFAKQSEKKRRKGKEKMNGGKNRERETDAGNHESYTDKKKSKSCLAGRGQFFPYLEIIILRRAGRTFFSISGESVA